MLLHSLESAQSADRGTEPFHRRPLPRHADEQVRRIFRIFVNFHNVFRHVPDASEAGFAFVSEAGFAFVSETGFAFVSEAGFAFVSETGFSFVPDTGLARLRGLLFHRRPRDS